MSLNDNVTLMNIANKTSEVATKLDSNFIPRNTTFYVNADGSGDFPTLEAAINHLKSKYSNGVVAIQLGEGTFEVNNSIHIEGYELNIPMVHIVGAGRDKTTINVNNVDFLYVISGQTVELKNMHINQTGNKTIGVMSSRNSLCTVIDCTFTNFNYTLYANSGVIHLIGHIIFNNCNRCLVAAAGIVHSDYGIQVTVNTAQHVCYAEYGGIVSIYAENAIQKTGVSQVDLTYRNGVIAHK